MKSKILLLSLIIAGTAQLLFGQAMETEWTRQIGTAAGDAGHKITTDPWGNIYTTGYFSGTLNEPHGSGVLSLTSAGRDDIFLTKHDPAGNLLWARRMGGNDETHNTSGDQGLAVATDESGYVYTTGYFTRAADFHSGQGTPVTVQTTHDDWDVFMTKHDPDGNLLWVKTFGGDAFDRGAAISSRNGYLYVAGCYGETVDFDPGSGSQIVTSAGGLDVFVSKFDTSGALIWSRQFEGDGDAIANGIVADDSGNVYTTGRFSREFDFDPGPASYTFISAASLTLSDAFISKLSPDGDFVWAKQIGGNQFDAGNALALDPWGNLYLTGRFADIVDFDPGAGTHLLQGTYNTMVSVGFFPDAYVLKLDRNGDFSWVKQLSGQGYDEGHGICTDMLGQVYVTGYFDGELTVDNVSIDAGTSPWNRDVFILKLDSAGNVKLLDRVGSRDSDEGYGIAQFHGNIYTTGAFKDEADFETGPDTTLFISKGELDGFIHKLVCADTSSETQTISSCGHYSIAGTAYTESGSFILRLPNASGCDSTILLDLTIYHIQTPNIDVHGDTLFIPDIYESYQWLVNDTTVIPGADKSAYLVLENASYRVIVTNEHGCTDTSAGYRVNNVGIGKLSPVQAGIYPNPAAGTVWIKSPVPVRTVLTSIEGRLIRETALSASVMDVRDIAEGIYLLRLYDGDGHPVHTEKMIIRR